MQTPNDINFDTFYFNELLKTIQEKGSESYDQHSRGYLNKLISALQQYETAQESVEKLAAFQTTSDLAIFFSDILDQLDSGSPDDAIAQINDRASDFLEIFEVYLQDDEWKNSLAQDFSFAEAAPESAPESTDEPEGEDAVSMEEYCAHIIEETINSTRAGLPPELHEGFAEHLTSFLGDLQLASSLNERLDDGRVADFIRLNSEIANRDGEGDVKEFMGNFAGNVQQWAGLFKEIYQDHTESINAIFQPAAEETPSAPEETVSAVSEAADGERPFEELFDQVEEEYDSQETEEESAESMEGMEELVSGMEKLEQKPKPGGMSDEEIERRKMLRDYVASEVSSFAEEVMETANGLMDEPANAELSDRLQDSLKSLKDIGQIHHYPAVEQSADTLLQLFSQLQKQGQSFSEEEKTSLESIFSILPIYIDAAVENIDNNYHSEINDELSALRGRLFQDEPVSDIKSTETLETAFQDVVSRYARQINQYLAGSNGASNEPLVPIFANLSYWSDLLISNEAASAIGTVQKIIEPDTMTRLSAEDRQVVSDIVSSWESDFVNTSSDLWQNYDAKLTEVLENLDAVAVTDALEAFQQVAERQLTSFAWEIENSGASASAVFSEKLPNILMNLEANSALIQNADVTALCQSLHNALPADASPAAAGFTDGALAFVNALKENITSLPRSPESDALSGKLSSLFSAPSPVTEEADFAAGIEMAGEDVGLEDDPVIAGAAEFAEAAPSVEEPEPAADEDAAPAEEGDDEIIEVFNLEALNYINDLKKSFSTLQTDINNKDAWQSLGITAHTLKGSAQMVGRPDIAELAEPLDQVVELVGSDAIMVQPELVTIFHSLVDVMKDKIKDPSMNSGPVIAQLRDYIVVATKHTPASTADADTSSEAPAATPDGAPDAEMIYLKEQDPELLNIFQNEVSNNFDIVEKNLANLEKFTYDKEALQQVERAVHEIRAAAKMLGIGEIATISDKLEKIFEMLVLKKTEDLKGVLPFTRRSMMVIRELTNKHSVRKDLYDEIVENLGKIADGASAADLATNVVIQPPAIEEEAPAEAELIDLPEVETPEAAIVQEFSAETLSADASTAEESTEEAERTEQPADADETSAAPVSPQVLELYIQEAREQLDDINYLLLKLEKDADNEEMLHHLMRCMHTLKGSSGMVYATNIESLSHRCEDILERNIKESQTTEQELFDLLFEVMDEINFILDALQESGKEKLQKHAALLKKLTDYFNSRGFGTGADVEEGEAVAEETAIEAVAETPKKSDEIQVPSGGKKDTYLRLNINKMNHLLNLAAELVISNNQFKNQLDGLKNFSAAMNTNLKTFRDTEEFLGNILKDTRTILESIEPVLQQQPATSGSMNEQMESLQRVLKNVKSLQDEMTSVSHSLKENSKTYDENLQKLNKLSNDLLDEIMQARLVPINLLFQRFHRPIRDLARQLKKQIRLSLVGEDTELDRTLVDELYEPLLHVIRNAIDHGLETEDERKAAGKDVEGLIEIKASRDRNQVIIEITDDGKGIDLENVKQSAIKKGLLTDADAEGMNEQELFEYLFYPGFSTAKETTMVSGRGVGLDVVKSQIDKAKGDIRMFTEKGKGTTFSIRVPISLSVIQSMLVDVSGHIYSVPLIQVEETLHASGQDLLSENDNYFIRFREQKFPVVQLSRLLKVKDEHEQPISSTVNCPVIMVQDEGERVALLVDKIIRREEILIKSLGPGLRRLKYVSGGSIMADGQVVLVLDIQQIIQDIIKGDSQRPKAAEESGSTAEVAPATPRLKREVKRIEGRKPVALIVDDSLSIRKYLSSLLMQKGYITDTARNGYEALELLNKQEFDIMVTDLEMPKLSGYELIETLRYDQRFTGFPIIVLTGRAGENFRQLTTELGADAYVIKPFKDRELFDQIDKFIEYKG